LESFADEHLQAKNFFGAQNDVLYESPIPYVVLDSFGKIEWFNSEFAKNIAPKGENILGKMIGLWMKLSGDNISRMINEATKSKGMSFKLYSSDKSYNENRVFSFIFHGSMVDNSASDLPNPHVLQSSHVSQNFSVKSHKSYFLFVVIDISKEEEKERDIPICNWCAWHTTLQSTPSLCAVTDGDDCVLVSAGDNCFVRTSAMPRRGCTTTSASRGTGC
jgi:hypothetical protein